MTGPQPRLELAPTPLPSGFVLPSIHSLPPFFTIQPNPQTSAHQLQLWTTLILSYSRFTRTWLLSPSSALSPNDPWAPVFRNDRIKRALRPEGLGVIIRTMIQAGQAVPEQAGAGAEGDGTVVLCWRSVQDWASYLHNWAIQTGQTNTILTLYELTHPAVPSEMDDMPEPLLRRAIGQLQKIGKAQVIEGEGGGGVRFFV